MQFERFKEIISEEFNIPLEKVHGGIVFRDMEAWSSLHALLFIAKINEEAGVMISSSDLSQCKTLTDIHEFISNR